MTKFYAHPYSFVRPDPEKPLSEGIETANFIKELGWSGGARNGTAEYEEDSHVIRVRAADGEGVCFMPFGLLHAALIINWEPAQAQSGGLHAEWNPLKSQRSVQMPGAEMQLLSFDGFEESLLIIPLGEKKQLSGSPQQILAGSLAWALVSIESGEDVAATARDFNNWRAGLSPRELMRREIEAHWTD